MPAAKAPSVLERNKARVRTIRSPPSTQERVANSHNETFLINEIKVGARGDRD